MTKEEFIKKAKEEYFYTDEMIDEIIKIRNEEVKRGFEVPWESYLIRWPVAGETP